MTNALFVRDLLDKIVPQLQPQAGNDAFIGAQLATLSDNYKNAATSPSVSFADPRLRAGYIFQYVNAHARYLARILRLAAASTGGRLFNSPDVRVACLGGGPGTDAIGVVKYLRESHVEPMPQNLHCCVFDKEPGWSQNWAVVAPQIGPLVTPYFQALDVTQPVPANAAHFLATADLITMSYLISEVQKLDANGEVSRFIQERFTGAKPGALLVYVDNSGAHTTFFDGIADQMGWVRLSAYDWVVGQPQWGSFQEDITALEVYETRFGRLQRVAAKLSYRVYRKPT